MGLLGRSLSPELQWRYEQAQMQVMSGGILALVGLVTCIYGAVGAAPTPTVVTRVCLQCGRVLAPDVKFCPYCGKPLE